MNSRAFLCSYSPHPDSLLKQRTSPGSPPLPPRKCFASASRFQCRVRLISGGRCCTFRVSAQNPGLKSEQYEISEVQEKAKFKNGQDEEDGGIVPWREEFPKRWVIVILCFSAFLLCNMDRVKPLSLFFLLIPYSALLPQFEAVTGGGELIEGRRLLLGKLFFPS